MRAPYACVIGAAVRTAPKLRVLLQHYQRSLPSCLIITFYFCTFHLITLDPKATGCPLLPFFQRFVLYLASVDLQFTFFLVARFATFFSELDFKYASLIKSLIPAVSSIVSLS